MISPTSITTFTQLHFMLPALNGFSGPRWGYPDSAHLAVYAPDAWAPACRPRGRESPRCQGAQTNKAVGYRTGTGVQECPQGTSTTIQPFVEHTFPGVSSQCSGLVCTGPG